MTLIFKGMDANHTLRIAINGWFCDNAGAGSGQYIRHLLAHLPQLPEPVTISLLVPPHTAANLPSFAGVQVISPALPRLPGPLRKVWWEQITMPRTARQLAVDLLWVPYWAAPAWQPCPVVVTVHDLIPTLLPHYRGNILKRLYTSLVSWTARRSASIITVSHASARDIVHHLGVPAQRVHVVYHGPNQADSQVDSSPDTATPTRAEIASVRQRYQLPERYFLYLGGYDMRKNIASVTAAYARYLTLGGDPTIKLVLAGQLPHQDSSFSPDPRRQAEEQGISKAVHFIGRVDEADKATIYALATAFVFPSLYEGFGMMVLEAMAAGTPVITSGN
jgi:glycosyltransferase involved in cell wall biosynthesis